VAGAGVDAGLASRLSARLLKEFGSPEEVFRAPLPHLERCKLPAMVAQAVHKKQSFKRAEKELASTQRIDRCRLVNWTEPEYPLAAADLRSAGVVVRARQRGSEYSQASELWDPRADIIWNADGGAARPGNRGTRPGGKWHGTRRRRDRPSGSDGGEWAGDRSARYGRGGLLPERERETVREGTRTGCHQQRISIGQHPAPENFPIRNRIVAGMPLGVVVVEGAQYSGSLITPRLAMELGREVFAVPGNVTQ
jgi:DNA processing protein